MSVVDYLAILLQVNPLSLFALCALVGLLWGIQASFGANIGYRRNLEWQTGFIIGLITSGLLVSWLYSARPLESQRLGSPLVPRWLVLLGKFPSIVSAGLAVILGIAMMVNADQAPVSVLATRWETYFEVGGWVALVGFIAFTCLGGLLGKKWFDVRSDAS